MREGRLAQFLGTLFFLLAIAHTFAASLFAGLSKKFDKKSRVFLILHFLSEVEFVVPIWALGFLVTSVGILGFGSVFEYLRERHFSEPVFVFVVMVIAASHPITSLAKQSIRFCGTSLHKIFRVPPVLPEVFVILSVGSLLGSFITEPAAITLAAILLTRFLDRSSVPFVYCAIASLFVNISIGGALTRFAAPPILMVAQVWNWDTAFVFFHFGWKSLLAIIINSALFVLIFKKELLAKHIYWGDKTKLETCPAGVSLLHLCFLFAAVFVGQYSLMLLALFVLFVGTTKITSQYQDRLRLREGLSVALFLGGLIIFGGFQSWWLEPVLRSLSDSQLYTGSIFLTAFTDNAALTYLGSQVPDLSEGAKYFLVAGAIAGGGLTLMANAPNLAGYSILKKKIPGDFNPLYLFLAAVPPTIVAALCFEFLPSL
jgi:hypothetical protein